VVGSALYSRLLLIGLFLLPATSGGSLAALQQPTASSPWYEPDVYDSDSPGITMPELVTQTRPNYRGEAMHAGIEGIVSLECLIERDGSVGSVRVRHSLDTAKGLDDEAIRTVRQWRFKPGTKDGIPVRMRVPIEISFWLRGSPYKPEVGWPKDFQLSSGKLELTKDRLAEDAVPFADVLIKIKYPRDWAVGNRVSDGQLILLQRINDREARACALLTPKATEMDLMVPVRDEALRAFEQTLRLETASLAGTELKRVGQIGAGHLWMWSEVWKGVAPADAARFQSAFEGMRVWSFMTTDSRHELNVVCNIMIPRGSSGDELKQTVRRAAEDFATILTGITVRPR